MQTLREKGFEPSVRYQPAQGRPPGTVISQNPAQNSARPAGSTVTIIVAETPSPTPTPTPTPTEEPDPDPEPTGSGSPSPTFTFPGG